jgi:hypothetical protein
MRLGRTGLEEIMKLLRSITRRGFEVGTAGWFTVLKQNTWFPASRLPGRFRYRTSPSAETTAVDHAISLRIQSLATKDRRLGPLGFGRSGRRCDHIRSAVVDNAP